MKKQSKTNVAIANMKPVESATDALSLTKDHDSLLAWFELYLGIEVGSPETNTFRAKKGDIQKFVEYLLESAGTDHPDQWTRSLTESFLRHLRKKRGLAASTVNRVLATLKHAAQWIHRQRPFLVGNPCKTV